MAYILPTEELGMPFAFPPTKCLEQIRVLGLITSTPSSNVFNQRFLRSEFLGILWKPGTKITGGHRPKSVHKTSLAVGFASIRQRGRQMLQCRSIALSSSMHAAPRHRLIINLTQGACRQKHAFDLMFSPMAAAHKKRAGGSDSTPITKQAQRQVSKETFIKWQRFYERDYQSLTWLRAEVDDKDKKLVDMLWCHACRVHESKICGIKNFLRAWILGSTNHKTSNITDHAKGEPHRATMSFLTKDQARERNEPITSYSPIAQSLYSPSMSPVVRERVQKKFELSFVLAKEHIPFSKYPAIHELEERHSVDLGFHRIPKNSERRNLWLKTFELGVDVIKPSTRICSRHFVGGNAKGMPSSSVGKM